MSAPEKRRAKLRRLLRRQKVDALLVTNFTNVTYLTGFTGDDSYLLVTADRDLLVTDPRYDEQLDGEAPDLPRYVRDPGERIVPATAAAIVKAGLGRVGVEAESMSLGLHKQLAEELPGVTLEPQSGLVEGLRGIKDKDEVEAIRHAAHLAKRAYDVVRASWSPDATERDLSRELEYQTRKFGGKGLSFPAIVAAGPRSALPHATPTDARVGDHAFTLIDWGVFAPLYASDLTRMVLHTAPSKRLEKVYDLVLEAQLAGIDAIRPGAALEDVDAAARNVIAKGGYGPRFSHGLGHGLGLEVHEGVRLGRNQKGELKTGMVVTVEPGIYLPGWGGVRIEDDVLVTKTGHELLSDVPKTLDDAVLG